LLASGSAVSAFVIETELDPEGGTMPVQGSLGAVEES
jgi:hypothetical protein